MHAEESPPPAKYKAVILRILVIPTLIRYTNTDIIFPSHNSSTNGWQGGCISMSKSSGPHCLPKRTDEATIQKAGENSHFSIVQTGCIFLGFSRFPDGLTISSAYSRCSRIYENVVSKCPSTMTSGHPVSDMLASMSSSIPYGRPCRSFTHLSMLVLRFNAV